MGLWMDSIKRANTDVMKKEDNTILRETTIEELDRLLEKGIVHFQYTKKDGHTIRDAYGTRNQEIINKQMEENGTSYANGICIPKEHAGYSTYYDMDVDGYRVFRDDRFLGMFGTVMTVDQFKNV